MYWCEMESWLLCAKVHAALLSLSALEPDWKPLAQESPLQAHL
jgi:hypothetical protein